MKGIHLYSPRFYDRINVHLSFSTLGFCASILAFLSSVLLSFCKMLSRMWVHFFRSGNGVAISTFSRDVAYLATLLFLEMSAAVGYRSHLLGTSTTATVRYECDVWQDVFSWNSTRLFEFPPLLYINSSSLFIFTFDSVTLHSRTLARSFRTTCSFSLSSLASGNHLHHLSWLSNEVGPRLPFSHWFLSGISLFLFSVFSISVAKPRSGHISPSHNNGRWEFL